MDERDKATIQKIKNLANKAIEDVEQFKNPSLEIPTRSLSNAFFDESKKMILMGESKQTRNFFHFKQAKLYMQSFLIAERIKKLIEAGATTSIRDIYYDAKHAIANSKENTFDDQSESDPIIEDLEVTLDVLREELHLRAENRGAMVGDITITDSGDEIDLRRMGSGGWSVPSIVEESRIQFGETKAKYILFIEKGAVWSRLNEDKFWRTNKCILIHGGGMAARGTRRLLRRMHDELKLPVYVLVDNDPWGFYIYSVVKQGSISLAYESMRMAVPKARFLGLSSFDKKTFKIPDSAAIKLTQEDKGRATQIMDYTWFKEEKWQDEMAEMLRTNNKYELEALSSLGIRFITENFIPRKIEEGLWIE